jgi:hypothetical protein
MTAITATTIFVRVAGLLEQPDALLGEQRRFRPLHRVIDNQGAAVQKARDG